MIEIELTEPKNLICECCGGKIVSLTRFVYKDGNAFAIYHATFAENHSERGVLGVISLGDWESNEVSPNRVGFPFRLWEVEENFNVGIMNRNECPWNDSNIIGRILDREEALAHSWIDEVYHITDHITKNDTEIVNFFKLDSSTIN